MAKEKITKKMRFEEIKTLIADRPDLVEFIDHEIDLLAHKSTKSATLSPAQKDTAAVAQILEVILAEYIGEKGLTVGAILKDKRIKSYVRANGEPISSQMITAILSRGVINEKNPDGCFVRTLDKGVAYFSLHHMT